MRRRRPMPSQARVSRPSTRTLPLVGRKSPLISFRMVDLPAPLLPTSTSSSPRGIARLTSASAAGRP